MTPPEGDAEDTPIDSRRLQDAAVRGAAWTMVHTVVSVPIAFVVNLLLAQVLAPDGYGRLAFMTTLIGIVASVLALGLTPAMVQFGVKAHSRGRTKEVAELLSASQGFRLLIVAPILTVLVLLLVDVPWPLLVLAIAFGVWVPALLDGGPIAIFIENKTAAGAQIAMISNLVVQLGVVVSVLFIGTADAVWAVRIALTAVGIGLALIVIAPRYRRAVLRPRLPTGFPPKFWRFALPTGAAALIGELAISRTEVVFLTWLSTPEEVGLFALAFGVSAHVFGPAHALTGPLIPAVSGLREVSTDLVQEAFARTLRTTSVVVALLSAAALPALTVLVPVLYGAEYARAAPALLVMGLISGVSVIAGPLTAFVLARLSARRLLVTNLVALAIDVALALALIPSLGLWGAVVANGCAMIVQMGMLVEGERRDLGLPLVAVLGMLSPILISSTACGLGWYLVSPVGMPALAAAALSSSIALVALLVGVRVTNSGMGQRDRDAVLRAVPAGLSPAVRATLALVTRS